MALGCRGGGGATAIVLHRQGGEERGLTRPALPVPLVLKLAGGAALAAQAGVGGVLAVRGRLAAALAPARDVLRDERCRWGREQLSREDLETGREVQLNPHDAYRALGGRAGGICTAHTIHN